MHCKTCDYPLWNLTTRICPECGSPFRPGDFEFVPNSVQFCCPHCNQPYYGTTQKGHLRPAEFTCIRCSQPVTMDEMVLRPTEGVTDRQTRPRSMPWLERRNRNWFRSWFGTIGMALGMPIGLMRATPEKSSLLEAWWFALLTFGIAALVGSSPLIFLIAAPAVARGGGSSLLYTIATFLGIAVGMAAAGTVIIALWGGITHLLLSITGGCAHSIRRTYQAICYSSGTMIITAVPCIGPYLAVPFLWIWWAVSAILMTTEGQRVHGGRAAFAVLVFPVIAIAVIVLLWVGLMFSVTRTMPAGGFSAAASMTMQQSEVSSLATELRSYAFSHGDQWPGHAVELIADDDSASSAVTSFVSGPTATLEDDVPVAGWTLADLRTMDADEQAEVFEMAAAALPADVVAHRVGDFVFTYHGTDPYSTRGALWLVIYSPDPDLNAPPATYFAARVDGQVDVIPQASLQGQMQNQNRTRAAAGLPPLPPPDEVTHDSPATAE